jgi:hypothetical protein
MRLVVCPAIAFVALAVACGGNGADATLNDSADPITDDGGSTSASSDAGTATSDARSTAQASDASSQASADASADASGAADANNVDAGPAPVTAAQLLALATGCKTKLSKSPYAADVGSPANIDVCGLNGAVFFHADMDVDCDGKSTTTCNSSTDPDFQNDTSGHTSTGAPLDAAALPFIVVPGVSSRWSYTASGIAMGSVAAVLYNGNLTYGIVGDVGPTSIIGEASVGMAKSLGINPSPTVGGVSSGVTYIIFTGTSARVSKNEDHQEAVTLGSQLAQTLVQTN